jgi:hypothetical protein
MRKNEEIEEKIYRKNDYFPEKREKMKKSKKKQRKIYTKKDKGP